MYANVVFTLTVITDLPVKSVNIKYMFMPCVLMDVHCIGVCVCFMCMYVCISSDIKPVVGVR